MNDEQLQAWAEGQGEPGAAVLRVLRERDVAQAWADYRDAQRREWYQAWLVATGQISEGGPGWTHPEAAKAEALDRLRALGVAV